MPLRKRNPALHLRRKRRHRHPFIGVDMKETET